jgi:hypothetical protein
MALLTSARARSNQCLITLGETETLSHSKTVEGHCGLIIASFVLINSRHMLRLLYCTTNSLLAHLFIGCLHTQQHTCPLNIPFSYVVATTLYMMT